MTYTFFKSAKELQQFLIVPENFDLKVIEPQIDNAVLKYLLPITGEPLLTKLHTLYNAGTLSTDAAVMNAFHPFQRALANIAYMRSLSKLNVRQSSGGFTVNRGDNEEVASQWRIEDLKKDLWKDAYQSLDSLINYLELKSDELPDYVNGSAYTKLPSHFLNRTEEMAEYIPLMDNAWLFRQVKPIIKRLEWSYIRKTLGAVLYAFLINKIQQRQDLDDHKQVMYLIKGALSHFTMKSAFIELRLGLDQDGVTVYTQENVRTSQEIRRAATTPEVQQQIEYHDRQSCTFLDELESYLIQGNEPEYVPDEIIVIEEEEDDACSCYPRECGCSSSHKKETGPFFFGMA